MEHSVLPLYPVPGGEQPLEGLYLAHNLRQLASTGAPYVYANFIASIDGRIAVPRPGGHGMMVPKNTANERDWRLYQELAAQADLLISSGRYLRDWAQGRAQEILQVDDPRFRDLRAWREKQGLPPQPDIAILSSSLDFPIPEVLTRGGRRVVFFTTGNPDPARVREIEQQAGRVVVAGAKSVEGTLFVTHMQELGYRVVYSGAGPRILHLLLESRKLDRLYLTFANRLLGGEPFSSLVEGPLLQPAVGLELNTLYFDAHGVDGLGQLFASFDCAPGTPNAP